jgi:GTPase-associated system helical domain
MNSLFADWHAEVSIGLTAEVLAARERAGDAVLASASKENVLDLIRVAYQQPGAAEEVEWFRTAIKAEDNTFRMRDNERETSLLAAAVLWDLIDRDSVPLKILAAYACVVAGYRDWHCLIPELASHADNALGQLGADVRTLRIPPAPTKHVFWTKPLQAKIAEDLPADSSMTGQQVQNALGKLAAAFQGSVDKQHDQLVELAQWSDSTIDIAAEEGSLVGWLLSGTSTILERPWSEIAKTQAAIVAGRELADQITLLPAPPQADSFLEQLLAATPFVAGGDAITIDAVKGPDPLQFLLLPVPATDDAIRAAKHAFRQQLLIRAWQEAS